jgi:pimeloyl-ACP methyl ester carboxylesterase
MAQSPKKTLIVGIHGVNNKPAQPQLETWWKASIREGLKLEKYQDCSDNLDFRAVYWADLGYSEGPIENAANDEPYTAAASDQLTRYRESLWDKARSAVSAAADDVLEKLKEHIRTGDVADVLLEKLAKDLIMYFGNPQVREKVLARFMTAVADSATYEAVIVIGHSMGSVIAYDVLSRMPDTKVDALISIGSPLGTPYVMGKLADVLQQSQRALSVPASVGKWYNFADRRDVVAIDTHLNDDYEGDIMDTLVNNEYKSPAGGSARYHKSYGYLRTPEIADVFASLMELTK